jgi:hypothetical protein
LGRSPLSGEILTLALTAGCALLGVLVGGAGTLSTVLHGLAGVGCLTLLLLIGAVYRIPGQLAWEGWVALQPLFTGVAWGLMWVVLESESGSGIDLLPALWMALLADAVFSASRWVRLEPAHERGEKVHPGAFRRRRLLLVGRLSLSSLLSPAFLLAGFLTPGLLAFSAALLLDRYAFYALAVRQTTEAEVARVEALLT